MATCASYRATSACFNAAAIVILLDGNCVTLSTGRNGRLRQSNRSTLPTVYMPVRGPYCPLMSAARVGAQFGPHV